MNLTQLLMAADRVNNMSLNDERLVLALDALKELQNSGLLQAAIEFETTRLAKVAAWHLRRAYMFEGVVEQRPLKPDGTTYTYREVKNIFREAEDKHDEATIALHDKIRELSKEN